MTAQSDFMQAREAQWKVLDKGFEYRLLCRHCVQSCVVQKTGMISGALAVPILDHERMHIHVASNLRQMRRSR